MYELKKSTRARNLRITVQHDGSVIVTMPHRMSEKRAHAFAESHASWIRRALAKISLRPQPSLLLPKASTTDFRLHKEVARKLVEEKLLRFNKDYGFVWSKVFIKNTKTRWGSCSKQKNLNFSYRVAHLPNELADYLVVHELCHLGEFNHSPKFWKLVEKTIPNYLELRKQLRGL